MTKFTKCTNLQKRRERLKLKKFSNGNGDSSGGVGND